MDVKALYELGEHCFSKRTSLVNLWQEQAENFYPQRADFTYTRSLGTEFAENLMTSYPILAARDLSDQISTMLRPSNKDWFKVVTSDMEREDNEAKRWLEWAGQTQRRAMYDRNTMFTRATREGDNDFATFGQCVITVGLNRNANRLLYRCWHLRDVAWIENSEGKVCAVFRKWKPHARTLVELFRGACHREVTKTAEKAPYDEIECMHMVVEADMFDGPAGGKPYYSVHYDIAHKTQMEAKAVFNQEYVIPRWQTVSGSQYAFSPATVAALPDARLLQAMMHTLLEAGEKAVNPPMVATQDAVRSDVSIYAGGITWVSEEYDERLGEALRPLKQDTSGIPLGIDLARDTRAMISQAFYLNKLNLPERAPEMTAYEVGQRIQEYIRGALPLFEPMEAEYNAQLCDATFGVLMRAGAFGSMLDLPRSLQGADIQFRFESPLHDAIEQQKGQKFLEAKSLLTEAAAIDSSAMNLLDVSATLRDVLTGIGVPAKWTRNEEQARQLAKQEAEAVTPEDIDAASKLLTSMDRGGKAAEDVVGRVAETV